MAFDPTRLYTALLNTGLQSKDNPLYQVIHDLIGVVSGIANTSNSIGGTGAQGNQGIQGIQGPQGPPGNILEDNNDNEPWPLFKN